jgi:hypothetical protein
MGMLDKFTVSDDPSKLIGIEQLWEITFTTPQSDVYALALSFLGKLFVNVNEAGKSYVLNVCIDSAR